MQDELKTPIPDSAEADAETTEMSASSSESRPPEPLTGKQRASKFIIAAVPLIIVALFFAYLWVMSGVLPVVEKYPNEQLRVTGYVKRDGVTYKRTGAWSTYHPNGRKASEGRYNLGNKVPETWHYWDESGKELPADPEAAAPIAPQP